ncbi:MAG: flagellar export protein FliJ [Gammaproteobacteria bacterium]|nr:flagellar export protein FliJ [Gammaproteobacteria bacterium]
MRSKRMQPVADHADRKEQDAVRVFVAAQDKLAAAELQLEQLLGYLKEYEEKLQSSQASGIGILRIRDFYGFLDKLNLTIEQAYIEIEICKQQCDKEKQLWLACRSRSRALNMVVEKYQLEEFKQQERAEQKEMDEHAQRIVTHRHSDKS